MRLGTKIVLIVIGTLVFIALSFGVQYRDQLLRAERRDDIAAQDHQQCLADLKYWLTTHRLIAELGKPGGTGKRLQDVVIPPGTDPQTIDILRQITGPDPGPPDLTRFYDILGARPRCRLTT